MQKNYLGKDLVNTIYLGGGTPSLLDSSEIRLILSAVQSRFFVSNDVEITLEANPDDVNKQWIKEIKNTDINRLSLGVQSFFDDDLAYLNRVHSAEDAKSAIEILQDAGLSNITIDLIYGIPGLSQAKWEQNLETFFKFDLPHLSAYALTVEEKTALYVKIRNKKAASPDESAMVDQFKTLLSLTEDKEYIHYEISNFARQGHYSRHNSIYWTGGHYLGLGPSAHSYNGFSRRWNKPSMKAWLDLESYYNESFEEEVLTGDQRYNEYVMTSLRTIWGCDLDTVKHEFGDKYASMLLRGAQKFINDDSIILKGNSLFLTPKGKLFADGISAELFA